LFAEIPLELWLGGIFALYMAWAIGANDVANAMGTSVGSGALTITGAIIVAGLFEFAGAFFAGSHVTDTVRKGMLDTSMWSETPELLMYGMLASLVSAGTLLLVATRFGLPISTTHSIVGAIVGFGAVGIGVDAVAWGKVGQIVASWVTSPLLGGVLAYMLFQLLRRLIFDHDKPAEAATRYGPYFFFYVFFIIGLVTLFKGLKHVGLDLNLGESVFWSAMLGVVGFGIGKILLARTARVIAESGGDPFVNLEKVFVILQILTACAVAFAHGSNDVANSIGPLAAIGSIARGAGIGATAPVEPWMLVIGGLGIVCGLATWGYRVMETVGKKITELTPSRGFAAELAAATTIVIASRMGIPVSTTHILVGAVFGVGLARGFGALDMRVVGSILISWIATLPLAATLSIVLYYFFKAVLEP
jgi:PiT family inorganic phosphate transporter